MFSFSIFVLIVYNSTKIVLFGGNNATGISVGILFILDITNLTWTTAESVESAQYRAEIACSVSGDNFIVWGGNTFVQTILQIGGGICCSLFPYELSIFRDQMVIAIEFHLDTSNISHLQYSIRTVDNIVCTYYSIQTINNPRELR